MPPQDRITITTLAERVIREAAPWIEPEMVGDFVEWHRVPAGRYTS